ncbi:CD3324 family protein [Halobacillus faecis]
MKYVNAKDALPIELLKEVQKYIQGETLYVPKSGNTREKWGARTGIRRELSERNRKIKEDYADGKSIEAIAGNYHLSVETIKKIIYSRREIT